MEKNFRRSCFRVMHRNLRELNCCGHVAINSDVVETVTSETETGLKFRDRDFVIKTEIESWKFETSHFSDGN